jgi:hypothetical protein
MKKFHLKQIIKEEIKKIINESFESDVAFYTKGNYNEFYYFGGYEYPNRRSTNFPIDITTAIDIKPSDENEVWEKYIQADLNKIISFPPKKVIFIPMGVIGNYENVSKNINNLLKSKGIVIIEEYVAFSEGVVEILKNKYGFIIIKEDIKNQSKSGNNDEEDDYESKGIYSTIILQKP